MEKSSHSGISLNENEMRAFCEIKNRICARFPANDFILFGSKARGDAHLDSDIDLLIIIERELDWRETDMIFGEVYEANLSHGTLFTAHPVTRMDWENGLFSGFALKNNIEKDGIVL